VNLLGDETACNALRSLIQIHACQLFDAPEPVVALRAWLLENVRLQT